MDSLTVNGPPPRRAPRAVLTVNTRVSDRTLHRGGDDYEGRRTDFDLLATALSADVVDWEAVDASLAGRFLRRRIGFGPVAAILVFLRRNRYDAIWCFSEVEGLLLAFLFKIFRVRRILYFIGIEMLSPKCLLLLRLRVWTHFTAVLPTSSHQAAALRQATSVPGDKVIVLPYQVDCGYFSGRSGNDQADDAAYIVAAGLESRDYGTLVEAVRGLGVELRIAASSLWSGRGNSVPPDLPANVTVGSYSYPELRRLYSGAALAVVPLNESQYQHGITALQEAMAMGLPVIVTRTTGQSDVVIDRRRVLRSDPQRQTRGGFVDLLAPGRADLREDNGLYVAVGDVAGMRRCITYLLENRAVAARLGAQAQYFARELLSIDLFVQRAVRLVTAAREGARIHPGLLSNIAGAPESQQSEAGIPEGTDTFGG